MAHVREQLAQGHYMKVEQPGVEHTGRRVIENAVATDISPLCPTIQSGLLRFRSFKYF